MKIENIKTLGELKKSGYQSKSIKDSDLERAEKKEAIKAIRDEHKNELKALLDAGQLEKFEAWEAKREERGGKKGKGKRGERPE